MNVNNKIKIKNKLKIRLWVNNSLVIGQEMFLSEDQSHYLCNVMRLKKQDNISVFNSQDGEFLASIVDIHKKQTKIAVIDLLKRPKLSPDIWLLFSPIKKDRTDFLIEKSVELGVGRLIPIISQYTITDKLRSDRIYMQTIEAAEQSERFDVPTLETPQKLEELLNNWDHSRCLYFMDERRAGQDCYEAFADKSNLPAAILVGPEGGFSEQEAELLYSKPFVKGISLGPRILRAETAVVSALSVWQAIAGDWRQGEI